MNFIIVFDDCWAIGIQTKVKSNNLSKLKLSEIEKLDSKSIGELTT